MTTSGGSGRWVRSPMPVRDAGGAMRVARVTGTVVAFALIAVSAVACGSTPSARPSPGSPATVAPSPTPAPTRTTSPTLALIHRHLSGTGWGISFDYPSDWHEVTPAFFPASFTNGDDAALYPVCCHLNPNQLAVSITTGSAGPVDIGSFRSPEFDVKSVGDWIVVKEMIPVVPPDLIDEHPYWMIGRAGPGETLYDISAILRGPDLAPMEVQVDALVDSIRLDPETAASPS